MLKKNIFVFVFFFFRTGLFAQYTNVMIDNTTGPDEPSVAINLLNTNIQVAGSNAENYYYSSDGGATWITGTLTSTLGQAGDPCMAADSSGNLFYFHLVPMIDRVVCQKSVNGGSIYNNGSFTWNNNILTQDKEWVAIDPHTGNQFVTWSEYDSGFNPGPLDSSRILFSMSADTGSTFTTPVRINAISGDCLYRDVTDPHPFVGANGEVYVTYIDSTGIRFNKSLDTGLTWMPSQPLIAAVGQVRYNPVPGVQRIRTMPYSSCDRSNSTYRGNLYVSWADQRNGVNNSDLFFIRSVDGGTSWSPPMKVNTDISNRQQFRNAMAVDQTNGYIYIVYYDRRNYSNNDSTDVYLAKSIDGGSSWVDIKISNSGFLSSSVSFDGDYIDIAAHAGIVRPVWTRMDNTFTSIWTCLYNESTVGINSDPNTRHELNFTVNPNPADVVAAISFSEEVKNLEGYILDESGRKVMTFFADHEREKVLDILSLSSGMYFVKAGLETRKLIIER